MPTVSKAAFQGIEKPIISAKLGKVYVSSFSEAAIGWNDFSIKWTDKMLNNEVRLLLYEPGLFDKSSNDVVDVKVKPISMQLLYGGAWCPSANTQAIISYEVLGTSGSVILKEEITTSSGEGSTCEELHVAPIIKNLNELSKILSKKLPPLWEAFIENRLKERKKVATMMKKQNRYYTVISSSAVVREMPNPTAIEIIRLPQASRVNITGSLESGWFQMSREGKPIGWVHSSVLKEDLTSVPTFNSLATPKGSLPVVPPPDVQIGVSVSSFDFGSYHALVVGINNYRYLPKLGTAINDSQAIASLLQNKYGFKVRILTDASRADILTAINSYRRILSSHDNLLIYYAGHGWLDKDADQGYWLPVNATRESQIEWVSNNAITSEIRAIQAKHIIVVADSCYSGKIARGLHIIKSTHDYFARISQKKARVVLSSGGLEPVMDRGGKGNHSVFASAFIDSLNDNDGVLDGTSLFTKIREQVGWNADQTPEYSNIHKAGHDGGDFLFVRKK